VADKKHKPIVEPSCSAPDVSRAVLALLVTVSLLPVASPAQERKEPDKNTKSENLTWTPPSVDSPLRSLSASPPCDLAGVLEKTGERASELASNLERFTAQEQIAYKMLDQSGVPRELDSGTFNYVFAFEQRNGGVASQEYRTPVKGSASFAASSQDTGQVALALIFHPNMRTDYLMDCQGLDKWNGQPAWVLHFQQRKDKPRRTLHVLAGSVVYGARVKGRAWVSTGSFQIIHLETNLMNGAPEVQLRTNAVAIDYAPVRIQSRKLELWLPVRIEAYWEFENYRKILVHTFTDFQLFAVDTEEKAQKPEGLQ